MTEPLLRLPTQFSAVLEELQLEGELTIASRDTRLLSLLGYEGPWEEGERFEVGIDWSYLHSELPGQREPSGEARLTVTHSRPDPKAPGDRRAIGPPLVDRTIATEDAVRITLLILQDYALASDP